jgi:hypothetical protein
LVKVGVIAIDGTKVHANASHHSNLDYEQLAREILKEAGELDAAEDELYGDARGCPSTCGPARGVVLLCERHSEARARQRSEREREDRGGCRDQGRSLSSAISAFAALSTQVGHNGYRNRRGFSDGKGFGFITHDDQSKELLVHQRDQR